MREVVVDRDQLLDKLRENHERHLAAYTAADEGYRIKAIEALTKRLAQVRTGGEIDLYFDLPEPKDHTEDYDTAIEMAEMSVEDKIRLTMQEFHRYVQDRWDWKAGFTRTADSYAVAVD